MSSILTNTSAMVALETLRGINKNLSQVQNEISTGRKVANAKDNAAVFAISTVMSADVSSFDQISDTLGLGSATVGVARAASEQVTKLLTDMKSLIVSAQEDNVDRSKIQTDVAALRDQINSIVGAAQFNGQNLLKGGGSIDVLSSLDRASDGSVTVSNINVSRQNLETTVQVMGTTANAGAVAASNTTIADSTSETVTFTAASIAEGNSYSVTIGGTAFEYVARANDSLNDVVGALKTRIDAAGITGISVSVTNVADPTATDSVMTISNTSGAAVSLAGAGFTGGTAGGDLADLAGFDVSTAAGATDALSKIDAVLQTAINAASTFGSAQKRIDIQSEFVTSLMDSMKAGISALVDADMEEASARLQSLQVQQQLGIQALSIANQSPQAILSLFR